jgi:hypothetical protein
MAKYNATVGDPSLNSTPGSSVGQYAIGQGPTTCIDFSSVTCLNFGNTGWNVTAASNLAGVGAGLYTIWIVGASIVRSIQFEAGADVSNRDPLTVTLKGSYGTDSALSLGSVWAFLYSGVTSLALYNLTRSVYGEMQNFTNTQSFTAYRMIAISQQGSDICSQFGEMHLFGLF